jgi:hypothetical protein
LGDLILQRLGWTYYVEPVFDPEDPFGGLFRSHKEHRHNSCTFVETHSEHLILRIQRRIRETFQGRTSDWPISLTKSCPNGVNQDDVAVLWVEPGENGSKVIELTMNADGSFIESWPRGFFAERLMEMYSINENEL